MDAKLSYDARNDVLRAELPGGVEDATAVPLRELVILLSASGEVRAIDVLDFGGFARKYLSASTALTGEALFEAVRDDLQRLLAPWFANVGPLAAEIVEKWDAPFARE
jgi:hypothetical protein